MAGLHPLVLLALAVAVALAAAGCRVGLRRVVTEPRRRGAVTSGVLWAAVALYVSGYLLSSRPRGLRRSESRPMGI